MKGTDAVTDTAKTEAAATCELQTMKPPLPITHR